MKISWIKSANDTKSFNIYKLMGLDVFELQELENTDKTIADLVNKNYDTIVVSNEVAGFSENIIKKYKKRNDLNIIIAPSKSE
jgi:vacuolar-type H+-ATPase subunit F/Vma7